MVQCMSQHIIEKGKTYVKDAELCKDATNFTKKLLEFKQEVDTLLESSFHNNIKFEKGRDSSFQDFMNLNPSTASYIAQHTDYELTKGIQGMSDDDINKRLSEIVRLFTCLHSRDRYVKSYIQYLSRRLLDKTKINDTAEELMMSKLKMELGINAVFKMQTMFKDITLS